MKLLEPVFKFEFEKLNDQARLEGQPVIEREMVKLKFRMDIATTNRKIINDKNNPLYTRLKKELEQAFYGKLYGDIHKELGKIRELTAQELSITNGVVFMKLTEILDEIGGKLYT